MNHEEFQKSVSSKFENPHVGECRVCNAYYNYLPFQHNEFIQLTRTFCLLDENDTATSVPSVVRYLGDSETQAGRIVCETNPRVVGLQCDTV